MVDAKAALFAAREKRVTDAIQLRIPDRIPIVVRYGFFPARYAGITMQEFMYDPDKLWDSQWKTIADFPSDMVQNPYPARLLGPLLDVLDSNQVKWPGRNLAPNLSFQFVEDEYVKAEEYPALLSDPSDFIVRRYWPRIFGALKGFEKLTPLHGMLSYSSLVADTLPYELSEVVKALDTLKKAGEESKKVSAYSPKFVQRAKELGFPIEMGATVQAPFDTIGDFFRGTKGIMLDMYRRPKMVLKACETFLPFMIERAVAGALATGNPRVFIPLHKGADGFMSREQFIRFYWPTLQELMVTLIDRHLTPCPFIEGDYTSRLDIIKDIPAGKAMYTFEATDLVQAKKVLGDRVCIRGNVPGSILATGAPDDVKHYCRRLMETVGRDGGFILDTATSLDDAKPENVRAMFEVAGAYA
ncbi:MAG TPA: uroporphyrinogen decarboxylase family protein [Syntrophorhabdales bacterium]|nr:uroporphyrinogen decarboxylase family protein [Syntrophorhabdales bacterium]